MSVRILRALKLSGWDNDSRTVHDMTLFLNNYEKAGETPDPEAWREEYRKKQAAGVKFEWYSAKLSKWINKEQNSGKFYFKGKKEDYREVKINQKPTIPHIKERALYWSQRAAGTNEVWQYDNMGDVWIDILGEPRWLPCCKYRVKPKTRTVYFGFFKGEGVYEAFRSSYEEKDVFLTGMKKQGWELIGELESREVDEWKL